MADLTATCPSCKLPNQHIGMACGFCGTEIPTPDLAPDGTVRVEELLAWKGLDVTGWRKAGDVPELWSPVFPMLWPPGQWMVAECMSHGDHAHGYTPEKAAHYHGSDHPDPAHWSPVKECGGGGHGCGFYAGRTRNHMLKLKHYHQYDVARGVYSVLCEVQLAGKIIPATNGWRAQKLKLRTILVPYELWELCNDLKKVYAPAGVDVRLDSTLVPPKSDKPEWCEKCSAALNRSPKCPLCGHTHL